MSVTASMAIAVLVTTTVIVPSLVAQDRVPSLAFRSEVDMVSVEVAVREGTVGVANLTSTDFELTDNGVKQQIDAVSVETVPVDVTLVMDISGSAGRALDRVKSDVQQMAAFLRPIDRMRLVTCSTDFTEVFPMQTPTSHLPLGHMEAGGGTSLNDAMLYALAWTEDLNRRHLVVVLTDGEDTSSALDDETVPMLASRADAVLHVVLFTSSVGAPPTPLTSRASLIEAARRTGGEAHELNDAVAAFRQVFEDFRQSYVLRYTLHGLKREGWHDLAVSVVAPGAAKFTVRSRRGYFGG